MTREQKSALTEMSLTIIEECRSKHGLDPREEGLNQDHHVTLTISIGEAVRFIQAVEAITKP